MPSAPWSFRNIIAIYVTGNVSAGGNGKAAAFYILVPISYLLLLSAGLVILTKYYKYTFHVACLCFLLSIWVLGIYGLEYGNLELLAIGLLGVAAGYIPIETINRLVSHRIILASCYLCYLAVITAWNMTYPIQIVAVCLNLLVLYGLGASARVQDSAGIVVLLGNYSLFGYIAQIAILQMLYRGVRSYHLSAVGLATSFVAAFALTVISVVLLDQTRKNVVFADRFYKAIFA